MQQLFRLPAPTLLFITCSWLAGILLSSCLALPFLLPFLASALTALLLLLFWSHLPGRLVLLLALSFLCGATRYTQVANNPDTLTHWIGPTPVELQGTLNEAPAIYGRVRVLHISAQQIRRSGTLHWSPASGELTVQTLGLSVEDPYTANYGDTVTLTGKLQPPPPRSSVTVLASMTFPTMSPTQSASTPLTWIFQFRLLLAALIERALPQPEAALLIGLLLSLRTPSLKILLTAFNVTGTAHLIAPSGFKVTILAGSITSLLHSLFHQNQDQHRFLPAERRGGLSAYLTTALVLLSILFYTLLSGAGSAAIRAGIMGSLLALAPRLGRRYNFYAALAFAALVMSLLNPLVLWDAGFQLSFAGTLGIVLLTPLFQRLFALVPLTHMLTGLPFGETLLELFLVTLAAQTATLPFMISNFQTLSFIAPVSNLLTVPLLTPFLLLGSLLCFLGLLWLPLAQIFAWLLHPLLWYSEQVILFCSKVPGAYLSIEHIDALITLSYFSLLFSLLYLAYQKQLFLPARSDPQHPPTISPRTLHTLQLAAALAMLLATATNLLAAHFNSHLSLTFFSVGPTNQPASGSAILLQTSDGKTLLIDGGLDPSSLAQSLDQALPSWQRSLDLVLLTTPRPDHLDGLLATLERFSIGTVIDPGMLHPNTTYARWRRSIDEKKIRYVAAQQGMQFFLGSEVMIQVLWPGFLLHKGTNESRDNALVVRILTPSFRFLLLGVTAESLYATQSLLSSVDPGYLQAEVVQVEGEESAPFTPLLQRLLNQTHAALLIETPGSQAIRKKNSVPTLPDPFILHLPNCQSLQIRETGSLMVTGSSHGLNTSQVEAQ